LPKLRKKKVTLAADAGVGRGRRAARGLTAADRLATAEVVVDNPYYGPAAPAEHRTIRAVRSLRDPLAKLHHTKRIDEAEYRAGRRLQALLEAAEVGHVRSVDTAREGVDGGEHMPEVLTERQFRAIKALGAIWPLLGKDASALVVAVLQDGRMPEEYARLLRFTGADDVRAMGRHFKWTLTTLARWFGLVG
jgi:hypothetical protein